MDYGVARQGCTVFRFYAILRGFVRISSMI